MMSTEDSLKVSENEDGSFAIEWDPNDPRYSFLNTMTEEEINQFFIRGLDEFIKDMENESNNSGS